jgi:hypothetical protein
VLDKILYINRWIKFLKIKLKLIIHCINPSKNYLFLTKLQEVICLTLTNLWSSLINNQLYLSNHLHLWILINSMKNYRKIIILLYLKINKLNNLVLANRLLFREIIFNKLGIISIYPNNKIIMRIINKFKIHINYKIVTYNQIIIKI